METRDLVLSPPQAAVYFARSPLVLDMAGQGAGKTENIGVQTAELILNFPKAMGFIGANTYGQLAQTTIKKSTDAWLKYYGWDEYDRKENPAGFYVVDKKPPAHFKKFTRLKSYTNTISFKNGAFVPKLKVPLIMFVDMSEDCTPPDYAVKRLSSFGWELVFSTDELIQLVTRASKQKS